MMTHRSQANVIIKWLSAFEDQQRQRTSVEILLHFPLHSSTTFARLTSGKQQTKRQFTPSLDFLMHGCSEFSKWEKTTCHKEALYI